MKYGVELLKSSGSLGDDGEDRSAEALRPPTRR